MRMTKLTETAIKRAITHAVAVRQRAELADPDQPGLRLRVGVTGQASWLLGCRDATGTARRFPLGAFPALGLRAAREKARSLREEVRAGADPIAAARRKRQQARDAREGINTLSALLDLYGTQYGAKLRSWTDQRRRIGEVFRPFLSHAAGSLSAAELQLHADRYPAQQSSATAVRYLRPVLKWAAARGYVPLTTAAITPPAPVRRRDRVLSRAEVAALLPVLEGANPYRRAMRFMLLTLARREEVARATWADVDLAAAEWRIPQTKNGTSHRVPLSPQALALLDFVGPPWPSAPLFPNTHGGALLNWHRETQVVHKDSHTQSWHRHDLRRTGATFLGELGVDPHVIEAALNHTAVHSSLASLYNQARYLPQVRQALTLLADRLDAIAGDAKILSSSPP
jgi:integrase